MTKNTSPEMTPYGKGRNIQKQTSIVPPVETASKGGFRPTSDKTVLGSMNTIMSDQYNKK
jgi:hypothetical protein|tara:strand:+ start:4406 stop:4585 length:180 start_codon:yes stop_codon:yes gene_type:complete